MEKLLDRLRRKHFLSIGRAGIDFYPEPPGTEIEHAWPSWAARPNW
jgi:hypothetical protein